MAIKSFNEYLAEASNEVTFVFGRFNPPTVGHEKLFDQLKKISRGGVFRIYASKSEDKAKNPLPFKVKIKFLRKMFPKYAKQLLKLGKDVSYSRLVSKAHYPSDSRFGEALGLELYRHMEKNNGR